MNTANEILQRRPHLLLGALLLSSMATPTFAAFDRCTKVCANDAGPTSPDNPFETKAECNAACTYPDGVATTCGAAGYDCKGPTGGDPPGGGDGGDPPSGGGGDGNGGSVSCSPYESTRNAEVGRFFWRDKSCAGVLIASQYFLTAARCVNSLSDAKGGEFVVTNTHGTTASIGVDRVISFVGNPGRTENGTDDLALGKLTTRHRLIDVGLADIAAQQPAKGSEVWVTGYNCSNPQGGLQCLKTMKRTVKYKWPNTDWCPDASGSAAYHNGLLIGIGSVSGNSRIKSWADPTRFRTRIFEEIARDSGVLIPEIGRDFGVLIPLM